MMTNIDQSETFLLDDDCTGVIWHDSAGWSGCLRWTVEGNTNILGPYTSQQQARAAVRSEFRACVEPPVIPDPD
jgi:hypothetical protein